MAKRPKNAPKPLVDSIQSGASISPSTAHAPRRNPLLLTLSIVLFAVWFVFLLMTALTGS